MSSIFAIDTTNHIKYVREANFIRLGILKDRLEGDEEVLSKARTLLIAIYDGNKKKTKEEAEKLLTFLNDKYGETITSKALEKLVKI